MTLEPLTLDESTQQVQNLYWWDKSRSDLSHLVFILNLKAKGYPMYIITSLRYLEKHGGVFENSEGKWQWNMEIVEQYREIKDDISDLIWRLIGLEPHLQQTLVITAGCWNAPYVEARDFQRLFSGLLTDNIIAYDIDEQNFHRLCQELDTVHNCHSFFLRKS